MYGISGNSYGIHIQGAGNWGGGGGCLCVFIPMVYHFQINILSY